MSSVKPVLVTRAAGLIGRQLLRCLSEQQSLILAVDRFASMEQDIEIKERDLGDIHRLHTFAREGIDSIIHCGANSGPAEMFNEFPRADRKWPFMTSPELTQRFFAQFAE